MRSLLARLALVGLVGIALAGCGTSNGTPLPNGSIANNSGGGGIVTTPGVGAPPLGFVPSKLIDTGTDAPGSTYIPQGVSGSVGFADVQDIIQAWQDPRSAAVPSVPASPGGGSPSQANDLGSHQITTTGNATTQLIFKFTGAVPNLTYNFGLPGNAVPFTYSHIIAHFWFGAKARAGVIITGTPQACDTVTIFLNGFNVGYTVSGSCGQLSAPVAPGGPQTVAITTIKGGFAPGQSVTIDTGNANQETVTAGGGTTNAQLVATFANAHAAGAFLSTTTDTNATIAAALVSNINNGGNPNVGPTAGGAAVYSWLATLFGAPGLRISASQPGTAGNANTISVLVQDPNGAGNSAGTTEFPIAFNGQGTSNTVAVPIACSTSSATPAASCNFNGGANSTAAALGTFTGWSIELVGNGTAAGPGAPANTYDVRVSCPAVTVGNSLNRFDCTPLPVYGALPAGTPGAPSAVGAQPGTYTVPVNAVFPQAQGSFTPINPTIYVVLNYASNTFTFPANVFGANPQIDYIYAAQ